MSDIRISRRTLFFCAGFFTTMFIGWYGGVDLLERGDVQAFVFGAALMFGGIGIAIESIVETQPEAGE